MAARKPQPQAPWGEYVPNVGILTPEAFERFPGEAAWRYELAQGRLIRMPGPGGLHGRIQGELVGILRDYLRQKQLGNVYGTTCYIFQFSDGSESVLCPDVSYTQPAREVAAPYRGSYQVLVPDLVAEIVSPNETRAEVRAKVGEYLRAGVQLIWTLWPKTPTIEVWERSTPAQPTAILGVNDRLQGGSILPGFVSVVSAIFR